MVAVMFWPKQAANNRLLKKFAGVKETRSDVLGQQ